MLPPGFEPGSGAPSAHDPTAGRLGRLRYRCRLVVPRHRDSGARPKVLYFHKYIILFVATSIGVQESTRDRLEHLKREAGTPSLDAALVILLEEHEELKTRKASDRLLRAVTGRRRELVRFAKRHGIKSLAVFGSAIHGDARRSSDLDLLVDFEAGKTPGLIGLGALQRELCELLDVPVDLQTPGSLSEHIRSHVLAEALEIHVTA